MPDDVLIQLPSTVKARTEEIVIRNQDPAAQRVDVYQSLRLMSGEAMGQPIKQFVRSVPVAELAGVEIDGITGLQIVTWIGKWAAAINAEDGPAQAAAMAGQIAAP
jgi:hypothetical protein